MRCRCGGKYDISFVARLLLSPTVKKFQKSVDNFQSYEWISSGTFLWPTIYIYLSLATAGKVLFFVDCVHNFVTFFHHHICSKRQHTAIEKQVSRTDKHKVHLHLP